MEDIIKRVQEGDEIAFKQLTQSIENDLYRVAKTRLSDDDDIKDAIQNTMIITYKNARKIKDINCFKTWMIHVLINECNQIYKKNKKNNEIFNKLIIDSGSENHEDPIQEINNKMSFDTLIEKLNYDEKIVLTLYYNSGLSYTQISKILKINVNTIKSRLTRSVNKLKRYYKEVKINDSK